MDFGRLFRQGRTRLKERSLRFSTLILAMGGMLSKILGLIRQWLMALLFGTSAATDSWLMASIIPVLLFEIIGGSFNIVMIPLLSRHVQIEEGPEGTTGFLSEIFSWIVVLTALMMLPLEIFAPQLVHLIAPGFNGPRQPLTVLLLRVMLPAGPFLVLGNFMNGVLQSKKLFIGPALTPVIINMVRILTMIGLGLSMGITGVAIGFTLAQMAQLLYLVPALRRQHIQLKLRLHMQHPWTRLYFKLAIPTIVSHSVQIGGTIIDRIFASTLAVGRISGLNFSQVISQLPIGLVVTPIVAPVYTRLSELFNQDGNSSAYQNVVRQGLQITLLVVSPFVVTLFLLRVPLVEILYQHGRFNRNSTALTARLLGYWTIGILGTAINMLFSRILFSQKATRTVSLIAMATMGVNILGDFLLIGPLGAAGLALATSFAAWFRALVMATWLWRHNVNPWRWRRRFFAGWIVSVTAFTAATAAAVKVIDAAHITHWYFKLILIGGFSAMAWILYGVSLTRFQIVPRTLPLFGRWVKKSLPRS